MKHIFIINPVAGNRKYQISLKEMINDKFEKNNLEYEVYITKSKGDCKSFIDEKCKENVPCIFYACGGDGTLHEVINAACMYDNTNIGLVPCGSGNDFVKSFNNIEKFLNLDNQINGKSVPIDLIKVGDVYAVSVCNIGFDADAAFNMHRFKKIPFISGSGCYYLSVLCSLLKKLGKKLEFKFDDDEIIKNNFLVSVIANGNYYGGGYMCAPYASIDDGLIDICLVRKVSRLKILKLIDKYKNGEHLITDGIKEMCTYRKCSKLHISSDMPINLCIDGDSYIYNNVDFEIARRKINFIVPDGVEIIQPQLIESSIMTSLL